MYLKIGLSLALLSLGAHAGTCSSDYNRKDFSYPYGIETLSGCTDASRRNPSESFVFRTTEGSTEMLILLQGGAIKGVIPAR